VFRGLNRYDSCCIFFHIKMIEGEVMPFASPMVYGSQLTVVLPRSFWFFLVLNLPNKPPILGGHLDQEFSFRPHRM
jgi:hypothetical protein